MSRVADDDSRRDNAAAMGVGIDLLRRARGLPAGLLGLVLGCAPALDWRDLQPVGWHVRASLPCRPASHERQLPLAGASVALSLWACRVDTRTFALSATDLADPARVGPALQALTEAARVNLQGRDVALWPAQVPGMTPNDAARRWRFAGQMPDGRAVISQGVVFAHGARVYQATLVSEGPEDDVAQLFFDGLRVLP